jgi:hypothetical protein
VLEEYISLSHNTANGISEAIKYFKAFSKSDPTIKKAIGVLQENYVGEINKAGEWKDIVHGLLPVLNKIPRAAENFYKFCLQTKKSNGKLKLAKINTNLNDYIEGLGLEHITVKNGKIAPK